MTLVWQNKYVIYYWSTKSFEAWLYLQYRCDVLEKKGFRHLFTFIIKAICARLFICALWSPAGKGLTSWLSFVVSSVSLSLSHWYPGSGVVLDCIDSWSLNHYLLLTYTYVPSRLAHFTHSASVVWNRKTQRSLVRGRGTSIFYILWWVWTGLAQSFGSFQ